MTKAAWFILLLLLIFACSRQTSQTRDVGYQSVNDAAGGESLPDSLPKALERNLFVFQDSDLSEDIPWQNWQFLGTFIVDSQERHALLVSPTGDDFVVSKQSQLPENNWTILGIESNTITFVSASGVLYSMNSGKK